MVEQHHAIVLSHGPGGLGAARALARRRVDVTAIAYDETDPVLASRLPAIKLSIMDDTDDTDERKEAKLLEILRRLPDENAVLVTTSDRLVAFMSRYEEELRGKFRFRLPPPGTLEALNDKRLETELVQSLGFAIPATVSKLPPDPDSLEDRLRYPIIFKPHVFSVQNVFPLKNAVVRNQDELRQFYIRWRDALPVLLAQEVIPGPDRASWICSCTYDEQHRLLDCGIKQKLRALPAHFGGSTFAVSKTNPAILELARALGDRLGYVGHAGIEFRWDERDQQFKYIEWNPRMPANVGFDEACGMPTVWNSYRVALTGKSASGARQRDGIYYLDFKGDFFSMRADGLSAGRALFALFRLLLTKRTNGPWFAWDDPMPGMLVAWRFARNALQSAKSKISTRFPPPVKKA